VPDGSTDAFGIVISGAIPKLGSGPQYRGATVGVKPRLLSQKRPNGVLRPTYRFAASKGVASSVGRYRNL
jgi:hypothetical protein